MSFLQPSLLWGLLAVSIPIIIHLLNRRRHRTVRWAAMDFLLKATRESRGKKKLKHFIILACRALAIAALLFAIARPLIGGFLGLGARVDTVLLILDRSASMERKEIDGQPTKRELVLQQVAEAMNELESARLLLLDSATGKISEVPSPSTLPELSTTTATDTATNIPNLLVTALDYLQAAQLGHTEIWISTDLQLTDWRIDDSRWAAFSDSIKALSTPTSLRILALPETPQKNLSIQLLSQRRNPQSLSLDLEITLDQFSSPAKTSLTFNLDGAPTTETITIQSQTLRLTRKFPLPHKKSTGWGEISLGPDSNLRDNHLYFTYGSPQKLRTTFIHDNSLSEETITALSRAAAPPQIDSFAIDTLDTSRLDELDLSQTHLLIWAAPFPTATTAILIRTFLESGGQALFLPSHHLSSESFAGWQWGNPEAAPAGKFFITDENWRRDEGPFRDGDDGTPIPLQQLRSIKRLSLTSPNNAISLASWDNGEPLLSRQILGQGSAHLLTTLPDYTWSNLEQNALHLVIIQRLLQDGAKRFNEGQQIVGENKASSALLIHSALATSHHRPFPLEAGIYRIEGAEANIIALNLPDNELTITKLDPSEIHQKLLPDAPVTLFEQQAESSHKALLQEIWRPFLIAVLIFLLTEAILTLNRKPAKEPLS